MLNLLRFRNGSYRMEATLPDLDGDVDPVGLQSSMWLMNRVRLQGGWFDLVPGPKVDFRTASSQDGGFLSHWSLFPFRAASPPPLISLLALWSSAGWSKGQRGNVWGTQHEKTGVTVLGSWNGGGTPRWLRS